MEARELTRDDVRSSWSNEAGQLVTAWELAIAWDDSGNPTHWRPLDGSNPVDEKVLWLIGLT